MRCTYDPKTYGGWSKDGRKVKGTLHWVSASDCINAEIRLYNHLFLKENPELGVDNFIKNINPNSLIINKNAKLEKSLIKAKINTPYQFIRNGYFCLDKNSTSNKLIFNRSVEMRDNWKYNK